MGADINEKNKLDDDFLGNVSGGARKVQSLVHRSTDKTEFNNTLYSGKVGDTNNLLYQEDKGKGKGKGTGKGVGVIDLPIEDARLC